MNRVHKGTSFRRTELNNVIFDSSSLAGADFTEASIDKSSWWDVEDLDCAIFGKIYLQYSKVKQIFGSFSNTEIKKYEFNNLNLKGINLAGQNLKKYSFVGTDLRKSNLRNTILEGANLTGVNLNGADLTGADLTGACLKDFNYDEQTVFKNVKCNRLDSGNSTHSIDLRLSLPVRHLQDRDFENFFKKEDNAKLLIRNTVNPKAINSALSRIIKEYKIEPDSLRGIRSIGDYLLVEFKVPENTNKGLLEEQFQETVENQPSTSEQDNNSKVTPGTITNIWFIHSRSIKITSEFFNSTGANSINLGNISGTVSNEINDLSSSPDPNQPGIKELLTRLQNAIEAEIELEERDKIDALEELKNLAEASEDDDQNAKKTKARKSLRMLARIVNELPPTAALIDTCQELLPAIAKLFE